MKRKMTKLVLFILKVMAVLFSYNSVFAGTNFLSPSSIVAQSDSTANSLRNTTGIILAVVQVIGVSVAVIMLLVVGIKYMYSAPNDRAEIKKHMVVYVVGAVVLFASSGILGIIRGFVDPSNLGVNVSTAKIEQTLVSKRG